MIGFSEGKFLPVNDISVPVTTMSLNRGYGAFEFFQVINKRAFYGESHLARFEKSTTLLKIKSSHISNIQQIVNDVIEKNQEANYFIKILALPNTSVYDNGYGSHLYVFPVCFEPYSKHYYSNGAALLLKKHQRFLPMAKSINYMASQYWVHQMHHEKAIDVLYYDGTKVYEASRGNIFVVKNGTVYTPDNNILLGITRNITKGILSENGTPCIEQSVFLYDVLYADEVFLTSTRKQIMPVTKIGDYTIGGGLPGAITKMVMERFKELKSNFGSSDSFQ